MYIYSLSLYTYKCESKQYYEDAKGMLNNYASYLENNNASPILLESFFKFEMENYILSGVIDRLDIDQTGSIAIYDYKTSKIQKTKSLAKSLLYRLAPLLVTPRGGWPWPPFWATWPSLSESLAQIFARTHARNANTNTKHDFPVGAAALSPPQPPIDIM